LSIFFFIVLVVFVDDRLRIEMYVYFLLWHFVIIVVVAG